MKRSSHRAGLAAFAGAALAALALVPSRAASAQAVVLDVTANFGDNKTRLLSRTAGGAATIRVLDAGGIVESSVTYGPFAGWTARGIAPSANNESRLLWSHTDGRVSLWILTPNGQIDVARSKEEGPFPNAVGQPLRAIDLAEAANRRWCLLLTDDTGVAEVIVKDENIQTGGNVNLRTYGPYAGWTPVAVAASPDQTFRLLWRNANGRASLWRLDNFGNPTGPGSTIEGNEFGPFAGWSPIDVSVGGDGNSRLLWANTNGAASVWVVSPLGAFLTGREYGPYAGWAPRTLSTGSDSQSRLLWNHADTRGSLWTLDPMALFLGGTEYLP